jgi:hypothetical protein
VSPHAAYARMPHESRVHEHDEQHTVSVRKKLVIQLPTTGWRDLCTYSFTSSRLLIAAEPGNALAFWASVVNSGAVCVR